MKKITMLALGAFFALNAIAQSPVVKKQMNDIKQDKKELKEERAERNTAAAHGKMKTAKKEQSEIRKDRKHLNATKKHLKREGVDKPVSKSTGKPEINN